MGFLTAKSLMACILPALLLLGSGYPHEGRAQSSEVGTHIYVIDVSGSMSGLPEGSENQDIFPQVKDEIKDHLDLLNEGDRIQIFPFSRGILHSLSDSILVGDRRVGIARAKEQIDHLTTPGEVTWIYSSLLEVLEYTQTIPDDQLVSILIFTDGIDNGPEGLTFQEIAERFSLAQGERPHLYVTWRYYQQPGQPQSPFPEGEDRGIIEVPEGELGQILPLTVRPSSFDLGNIIGDGQRSLRFVIQFGRQEAADLQIDLIPRFDRTQINVRPRPVRVSDRIIELTLEPVGNLEEGRYQGSIDLTSDDGRLVITPSRLEVRFSYFEGRTTTLIPDQAFQQDDEGSLDLGRIKLVEGAERTAYSFRAEFDEPTNEFNDGVQLTLTDSTSTPFSSKLFFLSRDSLAKEGTPTIRLERSRNEAFLIFNPLPEVLGNLPSGDHDFEISVVSEAQVAIQGVLGDVNSLGVGLEIVPPPPAWAIWAGRVLAAIVILAFLYWAWPPVVAPWPAIGTLSFGSYAIEKTHGPGKGIAVSITEASKRKGRRGPSAHMGRNQVAVGSGKQADAQVSGSSDGVLFHIKRGALGRLKVTPTFKHSLKVNEKKVEPGHWVRIRPNRSFFSDDEEFRVIRR